MIIQAEQSVLIVVDVQGNLASMVSDKDATFRHINAVIQSAQHFKIPIILTEQAPEKIGGTIQGIKDCLPNQKPITKLTFSCMGEPEFVKALHATKRKTVIVCGIETHVCIYQSVRDLIDENYHVHVIGDAVSSRTKVNKEYGINRMRSLGAEISCTEMLVTELMHSAKHSQFKNILKLIK